MGNASLKSKVFSGLLWKCSGAVGLKVIRFVLAIVLARLLAPEDFGVIAIVSVFTSLGDVFIDSGFNDAIIQKKDLSPKDCHSVYWFNIFLACCIYAVFFCIAPLISSFYHAERLKNIFRVIALSPIIGAIALVPRSLLLKRMEFKKVAAILWVALLSGGAGDCRCVPGNGRLGACPGVSGRKSGAKHSLPGHRQVAACHIL